MSRTAPRTLSAPVVALLAAVLLVLGLAGGATAAKMITGKQIKNGTVTTADVKNGTVKSVDVRDGALKGGDLKAGSIGADRLAASARNDVVSDAASSLNIGTCIDTGLDACAPLAGTALAPGTWLVVGTVSVDNFNGPALELIDRCGLYRDGTVLAEARTPLAANGEPGEAMSVALQKVVVATDAAPVSLRCTEMNGESIRVGDPTVTAVRVK